MSEPCSERYLQTPRTDPGENFESVHSVIDRPLHVVHQVVCGASEHDGGDGPVLLFCGSSADVWGGVQSTNTHAADTCALPTYHA